MRRMDEKNELESRNQTYKITDQKYYMFGCVHKYCVHKYSSEKDCELLDASSKLSMRLTKSCCF